MTITLIHPSRSRPEKSFETYMNWIGKRSGKHEINHILSLDKDDPLLDRYVNTLLVDSSVITRIIQNDNASLVEAVNLAAKKSSGDILVYLSDDFDCPENWDDLIVKRISDRKRAVLRVNDQSLAHHIRRPVLTIPIMTRTVYEELGYFFYPEYKSMCCDNDLYFETKKYLVEAFDLVFPHLHYSEGRADQYDETYRRSEKNYNQGAEVFNRRSVRFGWPLKIALKA